MRSLIVVLGLSLAVAGNAAAHSLGWAVGPNGIIVHSETSGASWSTQASGTSADLNDIEVTRWMTGVAVGDGGAVVHTIDGGATWLTSPPPTSGDLHAVAFGDERNVWVAGSDARIFHSNQIGSGSSWKLQSTGIGTLFGIDFIDADTGWAVGTSGTILHTSNGGVTWSAQNSGTSYHLWAVDFVDASTGWAVGPVVVLHTDDGGATWSPKSLPGYALPVDVDFIDADHGWIASDLVIHRTQDGGTTWSEQTPDNIVLSGIAFVDENIGTAVGRDVATFDSLDAVMHTRSGGNGWDPRETIGATELASVSFVAHGDHLLHADLCRSQCELASPDCEEIPRSDFLDYPDERQRMIDLAGNDWCSQVSGSIAEGTCGSGEVRFIRVSTPFTHVTRFYDSGSLKFTGLTTGTDFLSYPCWGSGYWPDPIACPNGVVTAVHCGTAWEVDDTIPFPTEGALPIEGAFVYLEDIPALPAAAFILLLSGVGAVAWRRLR